MAIIKVFTVTLFNDLDHFLDMHNSKTAFVNFGTGVYICRRKIQYIDILNIYIYTILIFHNTCLGKPHRIYIYIYNIYIVMICKCKCVRAQQASKLRKF